MRSVTLSVLLMLGGAKALDASICQQDNTVTIVFQNGINTNDEGARANVESLKQLVGLQSGTRKLDFKRNDNPTQGLPRDLLEVFNQKVLEVGGQYAPVTNFWRTLSYYLGDVDDVPPPDVTSWLKSVESSWRTLIQNQLAEAVRASSTTLYNDAAVISLSSNLAGYLREDRPVVLVPHSQGNLYASAVYRDLAKLNDGTIRLDQLRILGVGVPAAGIPGTSDYITSATDNIVNGLRPLFNVLPANDSSVPAWNDDRYFGFIPAGHSFGKIYTSPRYAISAALSRKLTALIASIPAAENALGSGPLTATLNWDQPGDVDLHTKEPSGSHVYYGASRGEFGFLDRDDVRGTGPEHYYLSCDTFVEEMNRSGQAQFTFALNFYAGAGSRSATVVISALNQRYVAPTFILNQSRGSDGDDMPIPVYTVKFTAQGEKAKVEVTPGGKW